MGTQHILEYKISLGLWWCILSSRALHHENLALLLKQLLFLKNCFKKFYCKKKKKRKKEVLLLTETITPTYSSLTEPLKILIVKKL